MFGNDNFWASVGKIGALMGVIGAALAIYDWFLPGTPVVQARCVSTSLNSNISRIDSLSRLTTVSGLQGLLGKDADKLTSEQLGFIAESAKDPVRSSLDSIVSRGISYIDCSAYNYGGKTAKDVEMVPDMNVFAVYINGELIDLYEKKRFSIGDIKPSDKIQFYMLSTFQVGSWSEKYFGLKFDDGVGEVLIAEPTYSFWSYFESEIQTTSGKIFISLIIIFFLTLAFMFYKIISQILNFKTALSVDRASRNLQEKIETATSVIDSDSEKLVDRKKI